MKNIRNLLESFLTDDNYTNTKTMYNEESFKHELALFLRNQLEEKDTVLFEKSAGCYFEDWKGKYEDKQNLYSDKQNKTIKNFIDLVIVQENGTKTAIELKRPKKGDPENVEFWGFVIDIKFLEELVYSENSSISQGFFIVIFDKTKTTLYQNSKQENKHNIYNLFRKDKKLPKQTDIHWPFKESPKQHLKNPIQLEDSYKIQWETEIHHDLGYLLIEVSSQQ